MDLDLPNIKDKFDTESAETLVVVGYPNNKDHIEELIFWSCFINDPVTWIAYPYISTLRDDILAPNLATFLEFNIEKNQPELIEFAFEEFINKRGQSFRDLILSKTQSEKVKELFEMEEYSL